jgi:hypothetical protein
MKLIQRDSDLQLLYLIMPVVLQSRSRVNGTPESLPILASGAVLRPKAKPYVELEEPQTQQYLHYFWAREQALDGLSWLDLGNTCGENVGHTSPDIRRKGLDRALPLGV